MEREEKEPSNEQPQWSLWSLCNRLQPVQFFQASAACAFVPQLLTKRRLSSTTVRTVFACILAVIRLFVSFVSVPHPTAPLH